MVIRVPLPSQATEDHICGIPVMVREEEPRQVPARQGLPLARLVLCSLAFRPVPFRTLRDLRTLSCRRLISSSRLSSRACKTAISSRAARSAASRAPTSAGIGSTPRSHLAMVLAATPSSAPRACCVNPRARRCSRNCSGVGLNAVMAGQYTAGIDICAIRLVYRGRVGHSADEKERQQPAERERETYRFRTGTGRDHMQWSDLAIGSFCSENPSTTPQLGAPHNEFRGRARH